MGNESPKHCLCDESKEVHYHCERCDCILTGYETKLCIWCQLLEEEESHE